MMQIGPIQLSGFELPSSVTFGGQHRLSVHKSADGIRTIDALGPDDSDIQFHGIFSGQQAEARARTLNDLRLAGSPIWLIWNTFRYRVILKTVKLDYRTSSWILYHAVCVVLDQPGAGLGSLLSVQARVASDILSAISASSVVGIDISGMSTTIPTALGYPVGSTNRTMALQELAAPLTQLNQMVQTRTLSQPIGSSFGTDYAMGFQSIVSSASMLSNAVTASSYLSKVKRELQN